MAPRTRAGVPPPGTRPGKGTLERPATGLPPLVVVGGSAGGLEALRALVAGLPAHFAASVLVVIHTSPDTPSRLPDILSRCGPLPASHALHGERPLPGHIYVAPPDNHLTLQQGRMRVVRGPRVNGHRPAVDPLFRSAAREGGSRVWGVVLSGTLGCGVDGLALIKARGGTTLVQDPRDALFAEMPASSIARVGPHHVVAARDLGPLLGRLVGHPRRRGREQPVAAAEVPEALDAALWAAMRTLREGEQMARHMAYRARGDTARRFEEKARALRQHAEVIEETLRRGEVPRPLLAGADGDG